MEMPGKPPSHFTERFHNVTQQPWKFGFIPLMRYLGAANDQSPMPGFAQKPQDEPFRLGQQATLIFAPREIAEITYQQGIPVIHLFGLGMLGPNGPLPIHFTETVRERTQAKRDRTLTNFLNIFHHRYLTLFYRAWAQSQSTAGLDRIDNETFTSYIARLTGNDPKEVDHTFLPAHARWAASAHLIRRARNPYGLAASLSRFFGIDVVLHEYQLHWIEIESVDTCRLGAPRISSMLGQGALAGEVIPDRQHKFQLELGPLSLQQYLRLTPQGTGEGSDLNTLVEWVRAFIGYEYIWEVKLHVRRNEAPPACLGGKERLSWSSWMGTAASEESVTGMVYEPENYVRQNGNSIGKQWELTQ